MIKRSEKNDKKKLSKRKKAAISIIAVILVILIGAGIFAVVQVKKIKTVKLPKSDQEIGIKEQPKVIKDEQGNDKDKHKVTNILLLGVDKQEDASDSIIVFSIDDTSKSIKMSSLMRDSYIDFGKGKVNKLNYAYHYGGPLLSVKTVNENYNLDIRDYVKVDFGALDKIVDSFDGVNINVKPEELKLLNSYVKDVARIEGTSPKYLENSGLQKLNGQQAVAYCRIRYVGNSDYERTERQRRVLKALFQSAKDIPPTKYTSVLSEISPYLETSMDFSEMISFGTKVANYGRNDIKETRVPYDEYKHDDNIDGIYYLKWDKEKNLEKLHRFIYAD